MRSPLSTGAKDSTPFGDDGLPKEERLFEMPRNADGGVDAPGLWKKLQLATPQIAGGALALIGVYGVSRAIISLTSTLMNVTLTQAVSIGFGTGLLTAAGVAGAAYSASQRTSIRPELVLRSAMKRLRNSQVVVDAVGSPVVAGTLRAYTIRQGHLAFDEAGSLAWVSPRVQMLCAVEGPTKQAMVSLEAERQSTGLVFTLLSVDVLGSTQAPIVVEGREDRLQVRGQLRGFLQSERVSYIEQTQPSPEEKEAHLDMDGPRA